MNQTTEPEMQLVKYRDAGMSTYTYFWKNRNNQMVGPFFDSEKEATDWMKEQTDENKD
jgi:hypothetical protein